ncbi:hypothetical protein NLY39_11090 [Pseudomonas sp. KHPS1]|nr:hypothetical protein [Pseudomonas sp. KHPS1]ATH82308.1 hypothetical protein CO724_14500 [Pseudomonas mendocina]UTH38648.1 hypothetical protein NLY39_11090 [Pseudomonas sp. KHPS1]
MKADSTEQESEQSTSQSFSEAWGGEDRRRFSELTGAEKYGLSERWRNALEAFRDGEKSYLLQLIRSGWPIPPRHYEDLAKIVEASKAPKGKGRQTLDYVKRAHIWSELAKIEDLRLAVHLPGMLELTAEMNRQDPEEVRAVFKEMRAQKVAELAELYGVKADTIEKTFQKFPKQEMKEK